MYFIALSTLILISIVIGKWLTKNWINPGRIMLSYWSVFILLAYFSYRNDYEWNFMGLFWIIISCIFFIAGNIFGMSYRRKNSNRNIDKVAVPLNDLTWNVILIFIVLGLLRTIIEIGLNGFRFDMFFNLDTLINMNTQMAYRRYNGGNLNNAVMQVLSIFVYTAPLCGGYSYNYVSKRIHKTRGYTMRFLYTRHGSISQGLVGRKSRSYTRRGKSSFGWKSMSMHRIFQDY